MKKQSKIVSPYSFFSKFYDQHSNIVEKKIIFEKIQAMKNSNFQLILELACGSGNFLQYPLELGYNCVGIDCSKQMLDICKKKGENKTNKPLLIHGDIRQIQFRNRSFDLIVITSFSVCYLNKKEMCKLVQNVFEWLKPGGILYIDYLIPAGIRPHFDKKEQTIENIIYKTKILSLCQSQYKIEFEFSDNTEGTVIKEIHKGRAYTPEEISDCAELAGFSQIETNFLHLKHEDSVCNTICLKF